MRVRPLRLLLVACALLLLTNGPLFFISDRVLDNGQGWEEPFTQAMLMAVAIVAGAAVLLDRFRLDGTRLRRPHPVAGVAVAFLTGWMVVSSLWSLTPDLTRGRSLLYVGVAALALVIADLNVREFRLAVTLAATVAVVVSLLTVGLSDSIGVDRNDDWRGIYTNRNSLAPIAGVAILMGLSACFDTRGRTRLAAALIPILGAIAMLGSGSRTAWLALVVAGGGAFLVVAARIGGERYGVRARWAALAVGLSGAAITTAVISRMWGEATFVQRRTIWSLVWDRIGERPLHGYGWFNVWSNPEFTAADPLLGRGSAHGSFLEVWLGLGLIGLVPFLVIIGLALTGAFNGAWRRPSVATWTWLALVLFLVIENLTESFVLWFSYNWVLLMAAALRCGAGWPRAAGRKTPAASELVSA